jgi:regulator of protease activity HflC (stomatin/prohibitin superfamily)
VLPSIVNEVTKAVVAQYNAAELLTKREIVSRQVRDLLTQRSADFRILLDDVAITHLAFSKEYTAAVEAKQVAQQDSERAKYIVERAIQEKKSIVIRAEGEAKSAELIGNVSADANITPFRTSLADISLAHILQSCVICVVTGDLMCLCSCDSFTGHQDQPCFPAAASH